MHQPTQTDNYQPPVRRWLTLLSKRSPQAVLAIAIILLVGFGYYWYSASSLLDRELVSQVNFVVYAPKRAPQGYTFLADSTQVNSSMLSYTFRHLESDQDIIVTVQARPASFDMAKMSEGGSITSSSTINGTLYNLSAGEATQYLLDTGDGLVFFRSASNIGTATINAIANDLQRLN